MTQEEAQDWFDWCLEIGATPVQAMNTVIAMQQNEVIHEP